MYFLVRFLAAVFPGFLVDFEAKIAQTSIPGIMKNQSFSKPSPNIDFGMYLGSFWEPSKTPILEKMTISCISQPLWPLFSACLAMLLTPVGILLAYFSFVLATYYTFAAGGRPKAAQCRTEHCAWRSNFVISLQVSRTV